MDELRLVEVGVLPAGLLADLARFLHLRTGRHCETTAPRLEPDFAFDPARAQYDSRKLLTALEKEASRRSATLIGVADVDLGSTIFSYVFGESRLGGDAAIVSMRRLRPEEYGLPADPLLPLARLRRVVLHEVGHLAGLLHCREPDCVMRFSGVAEEVDLLDDGFCAVCGETFLDHLRAGGAASSPPPIDSGDGR